MVLAIVAICKGNPCGYYVFLRWVACPVFVWIAWKAYSCDFGILMVNFCWRSAGAVQPDSTRNVGPGQVGDSEYRHDRRCDLVGCGCLEKMQSHSRDPTESGQNIAKKEKVPQNNRNLMDFLVKPKLA
jgi:hypothetical protein